MKNKDYYTELIYKIKTLNDNYPKEISVKIPAWDASLEDMLEAFHTLMIGATYTEQQFIDTLKKFIDEYNFENEQYNEN